MNTKELKKAMIDANKTAKDCANVLGITESTFSRKMSGQAEFWSREIVDLAHALNLSIPQIMAIFFD